MRRPVLHTVLVIFFRSSQVFSVLLHYIFAISDRYRHTGCEREKNGHQNGHRDPRMELLFQCVHNDEAVHWQVQRRTNYFQAVTQTFGGRQELTSVSTELANLMSVDTIIVVQLLGLDDGIGHCVSIVRAPNQVSAVL